MNEVWNLDPIYKGFDDPAFEKDLTALKEKVAAFASFTETLEQIEPMDGLRSGIAQEECIQDISMKLAGYVSLRQAADGTAACPWRRLLWRASSAAHGCLRTAAQTA